jgi:DHA1 family purine base/nucleoside efflux pump-like MFS transporter
VAATVEPEHRGSALGFHLIGGSASHFLAPLLGVAIAMALGWRGPYIVLAVVALVFGIVFYIMMGRLPALNQATQKRADYAESRVVEQPGRIRRLVAFMVLVAFTQSMVVSAVSFIPLFMVDYLKVSEGAGGAIVSVYYSAGIWAGVLGGNLSDRFGRVRLILVVCFALGLLIYFLNLASSSFGIGVILLFLGMFAFMRMPVAESYVINNTSEKRRSTILGIYFFGSMEGSALLTPLLGYIIDHQGFNFCYTVVAVSVVLAVMVCSLFLRGGRD